VLAIVEIDPLACEALHLRTIHSPRAEYSQWVREATVSRSSQIGPVADGQAQRSNCVEAVIA
jgi:hypothetical protein